MLNELVKAAGNKTKLERKKFVYAKKNIFLVGWFGYNKKNFEICGTEKEEKKKKNSAETFIRENVARILKHPSAV